MRRPFWLAAILLIAAWTLVIAYTGRAPAAQPIDRILPTPQAPRTPEPPTPAPTAQPTPSGEPCRPVQGETNQAVGHCLMLQRWPQDQWPALQKLWMAESGWRIDAYNRRSGACNIPQAVPCSKIKDRSARGAIGWGLGYLADRYGSPSRAYAHFRRHHWY